MTVSETIFATVVAALVISLITYLVIRLRRRLNLARAKIYLNFLQAIPDDKIRFFVRHIRDGKDEVEDRGPLLNKDKRFRPTKRNNEWVVTVSYSKNLGFQFKCYVDFPTELKDKVIKFLENNGLSKVSSDETLPNRLWFLIPKAPTCETVDHYINNFYGPKIREIVHEA